MLPSGAQPSPPNAWQRPRFCWRNSTNWRDTMDLHPDFCDLLAAFDSADS